KIKDYKSLIFIRLIRETLELASLLVKIRSRRIFDENHPRFSPFGRTLYAKIRSRRIFLDPESSSG
ncbi:MAG: hypothetical protein JW855_00635, partial [Gammaproteobacteria bacterium]|nr:hypothetical protein [Gammaproteobacteria bacterium]